MPHTPTQYRQGDVYLTRIPTIPAGAAPRPLDQGRVILAYGEVTGHAHQISTPETVCLLDAPSADQTDVLDLAYLKVDAVSQLVHEEHNTITLEPGNYRVTRQREYTPERIVNVAD